MDGSSRCFRGYGNVQTGSAVEALLTYRENDSGTRKRERVLQAIFSAFS